MYRSIALFLSFVAISYQQQFPGSNVAFCQTPSVVTPQQFFGFRSSLLQIFTRFRVECNGYLRRWALVSRNEQGVGLYLSVWRKVDPLPNVNADLYKLVGSTAVPPYQVTPDNWFEVIVPNPFPVEATDVVGIYYGNWTEPWSHNGFIPVTNVNQRLPQGVDAYSGQTVVAQMDATSIHNEAAATGGFIDLKESSIVSNRMPAVIAFVDQNYGPVTVVTTTLPPVTSPNLPCPDCVTKTCPTCLTNPTTTTTTTTTTQQPVTRQLATSGPLCKGACGGLPLQTYQRTSRQQTLPTPRGLLKSPESLGHASECFAPMRAIPNCNFTLNEYSTKYFFNVPTRQCDLFWFFEDCVYTQNLFASKQLCETRCGEFVAAVPSLP